MLLVVLLGGRPYRYNELHRAIEGIGQRMLTRTLRGLETDGLVRREVVPTGGSRSVRRQFPGSARGGNGRRP
jgi:DNA-binding HxlR family transcriptional regulator